MCFSQGPPGVAGAQGPRGLPGNVVRIFRLIQGGRWSFLWLYYKICTAASDNNSLQYLLSVFQGIPGIIGPPGPAGQRGDKVSHLFLKSCVYIWWEEYSDYVQNSFGSAERKRSLQRRDSDLVCPPLLFQQRIHFNPAAATRSCAASQFTDSQLFPLSLLAFSFSLFSLWVFLWIFPQVMQQHLILFPPWHYSVHLK